MNKCSSEDSSKASLLTATKQLPPDHQLLISAERTDTAEFVDISERKNDADCHFVKVDNYVLSKSNQNTQVHLGLKLSATHEENKNVEIQSEDETISSSQIPNNGDTSTNPDLSICSVSMRRKLITSNRISCNIPINNNIATNHYLHLVHKSESVSNFGNDSTCNGILGGRVMLALPKVHSYSVNELRLDQSNLHYKHSSVSSLRSVDSGFQSLEYLGDVSNNSNSSCIYPYHSHDVIDHLGSNSKHSNNYSNDYCKYSNNNYRNPSMFASRDAHSRELKHGSTAETDSALGSFVSVVEAV